MLIHCGLWVQTLADPILTINIFWNIFWFQCDVLMIFSGEVLFVPAGCPHYVESLTESIAISANFVDLSNHSLMLREVEANTEDERASDLLKQVQQADFPTDMSSRQQDVLFEHFKKWPRNDGTVYDITTS